MLLPFDPILFLAVIGLCIGSLLTIADATADDIAGQPHYYVTRQAIFFGVGMVIALVLSRVDYSRLRELKYGVYGLLIASIVAVQLLGSVARGSRRAIDFPFFSFQASELGKVLLVVALSAFIVDRSRRLQARDTTARIMLLTLIPAAMVIVQPDLGSGMVYIVIGARHAVRRRHRLAPLRLAVRAGRDRARTHSRGRAEDGRDRPARPTRRSA